VREDRAREEKRQILEGVEAVGPVAHMLEVGTSALALRNGDFDEQPSQRRRYWESFQERWDHMPDRTQAERTPSVSIVIATMRGGPDLEACLTSIQAQAYRELELIVIDNGSTDRELARVPGRFARARVLRNEENLGFVGANNQGIAASTGELVLLLNDDTVLEPGAIDRLVQSLVEHPSWAAAQAKLVRIDDPRLLDTAGSFLTATGFLVHRGSGEPEEGFSAADEIFAAKGAALLIRGAALRQVGAFDPDFFAYFEETDLCWRLWLAGWEVGFAAEARVRHKLGATAGRLPSELVQFHSFKNRICTLAKNLGPLRLAWMLPYHVALCLALAVWYAVRGQPRLGGAIVRALAWNVRHLSGTVRKRRRVQSLRRVGDRELMRRIVRPTPIRTLHRYARLTGESEPRVR
jgi:GT2 family glycosyltransferase